MAVSMVALFVALGATSYAAVSVGPRSVGSKELKPRAVAGVHIKANAVNSSKVKDGSLTGKDVNESALGPVASADRATVADRAASADQAARASVAGGLDRVIYRVAVVTVPGAPDPSNSAPGVATARCDPGQLVVGGGVRLEDNMSIVDSYPETAAAWTAHVNNDEVGVPHNATVYAICIAASTPG